MIIKKNGATTIGFLVLVSFFFNIHIIVKKNNSEYDSDILKDNIKDPIDILTIESLDIENNTYKHFEYIYNDIEKDIFDEITKSIDCKRHNSSLLNTYIENEYYEEPSEEVLKMYHEYIESYKN
jgi:hypothetical protein